MLFGLVSAALAADIISLPRDDTYHRYVLHKPETADDYLQFWVYPNGGRSAILVVYNSTETKIEGEMQTKDYFHTDTWIDMESTQYERKGDSVKEDRFVLPGNEPLIVRFGCTKPDCGVVIEHVHTDPVYRTSAVIGAFGMFICLFLLVFSWTLFCGACRATRKR